MNNFSHVIEENISPELRLDRYVSEVLCLLSRSQIKARALRAKVNGKDVKLSRLVKHGDSIELSWDDISPENIIAEDIPLNIIYENDNCIVINKAQGMVVHPGAGNRQGTLANALLHRCQKEGAFSGASFTSALRPGIVHRLDKETSGVIIAAYNDETCDFLARQFKNRQTRKTYIAVVCGEPKEKKGRLETFIARDPKNRKRFTVSSTGKNAVTLYKVIKSNKSHSLLLLRPQTGRTHQLRVHMRYLGHPVLGDSIYGCKDTRFPNATLMLHSLKLEITLPGETEARVFTSPIPERFKGFL
ncbi:MAG: RluA family pseudouridine synthase [Treponema sp.]|jgi:23S rRNA pseudouridine1911/1915/1917 synthase|nr:RluA family pseudouridine synthase [Treponema sp.]